MVCYSGRSVSSWGFLTTKGHVEDEKPEDVCEWFKIYLDPEEYEKAREKGADAPRTHERVRDAYRDYLSKIHLQIEKELGRSTGTTWNRARIEFLFSVPTTWTSLGVTKDFETLVREAGFGRDSPNHTVSISLTEAEAAAVYTFKAGTITYSVSRNNIMQKFAKFVIGRRRSPYC